MESDYAQTIYSLSTDLDNLWRDKLPLPSESDENSQNCSLNRFMLSATKNYSANLKSRILPLQLTERMALVDRLAKTASIWTRPEVTRIEAEGILKDYETGIFLVRMNSDKKTMVLTYRMADRIQHVMIMVDVKKGFYMNGSCNVFPNVNLLIVHYMRHSINGPDLCLKLPKALMEASEPEHFKFFANMKTEFWKTAISRKSITEIWPVSKSKSPVSNQNKCDNKSDPRESSPPLPPRGYEDLELNFIQGLADMDTPDPIIYQEINKNLRPKVQLPPTLAKPTEAVVAEPSNDPDSAYSKIWNYQTKMKQPDKVVDSVDPNNSVSPSLSQELINDDYNAGWDTGLSAEILSGMPLLPAKFIEEPKANKKKNLTIPPRPSLPPMTQTSVDTRASSVPGDSYDYPSTIAALIMNYYPQLVNVDKFSAEDLKYLPSLQEDLIRGRKGSTKSEYRFQEVGSSSATISENNNSKNKQSPTQAASEANCELGSYESPWDLQTNWVTRLIQGNDGFTPQESLEDTQKHQNSISQQNDRKYGSMPGGLISVPSNTCLLSNSEDDDTDSENLSDAKTLTSESSLEFKMLPELQPVVMSTEWENEYSLQDVSYYGHRIRMYLRKHCSRNGKSEISQQIKMFIKCTIERSNTSPYTTMRLIRQFMSGLKNCINQQKKGSEFAAVIEEEQKLTPKNVFINLDVMIESILTKEVLKPLTNHIYRLLILEHYKNNNLKLIADGVGVASISSPERLKLPDNAIPIIQSRMGEIQAKFKKLSTSYSPERKIAYLVTLVEIAVNLMTTIYAQNNRSSIKTDNLLPIFVYIFSQCKIDSIAAQCEVEFIEGLVWSSRLVNGEPGFFLLNLTSALEAIKVLGRPNVNEWQMMPNAEPQTVSNSSFYKKVNPTSFSQTAVGSINVIILDEKINRLVIKTFPVRSTVNVRNLCNTIAHKLGLFQPKDYCLFKFTGYEEIRLEDHESPLTVKQEYFQKTGEAIHFLFKRQNANFILPSNFIE